MNNTYQVGDIIHHKRYNYRGVIIGCDPKCLASEQWYKKNQTQPDLDQPWYHVLVDGAYHSTYVAEENLEQDETKEPVSHPLLDRYFLTYFRGRYYRDSMN